MFLDDGGWWIVWMVFQMEEQAVGAVIDCLVCASFDVRAGVCYHLLEDLKDVYIGVAMDYQPAVEQSQFCQNVQWTQAQSVHAHHVAHDKARQDPWWMGGVRWDVKVQVHFFLVECSLNPAVLDANGEVHKVARVPIARSL